MGTRWASVRMNILLDTVILIDHFNGIEKATDFIKKNSPNIVLSVVTRAEVLVGFNPEIPIPVIKLLDRFPLLGIDREIADLAAQLRQKYRWKLPDAFQAALAKQHDCRLATRNTKDFDPERYDFVIVPYQI